jgi:hypothetical protein
MKMSITPQTQANEYSSLAEWLGLREMHAAECAITLKARKDAVAHVGRTVV